jgi:hypothetical protein
MIVEDKKLVHAGCRDFETANIPPLFKRWSGGMFRTVNDRRVV